MGELELVNVAAHGLAAFSPEVAKDVALAVARASVGVFFCISGANKLFNEGRHARLVETLQKDNVPFVAFNQWWVPGCEFVGGALLAAGLFSAAAAAVLAVICIVALCCEGAERVNAWGPINKGDEVADWLYLQETLYLILLAVTVIAGTGRYSMDYWLFVK